MKNKLIIIANIFLLFALIGIGLVYFSNYLDTTTDVPKAVNHQLNQSAAEIKKELLPSPKEVSLIFTGDIMLSRVVGQKMREHQDYNYPFLKVSGYLKSADFCFGNLETAITEGREIKTGEMVFRADPAVASALKEANFKVLSLANNHTPNFGEPGLLDTFKYLNEAGIKYVGAGQNEKEAQSPAYYEEQGIKFAFFAYTYGGLPLAYYAQASQAGTAKMETDKMIVAIKTAKENADLVIVSMHAGDEYSAKPNQAQIDFAHTAIKAGADLVISHHPHVVQRAEIFQGKYIFYSLGNFIFDQMWSEETREGVILKITFTKDGVNKIEPQAVLIEDYAQPRILSDEEAQAIIKRLNL